MGGFDAKNEPSRRLHERLGYRVEKHASDEGYVALLENDRI